MRACDIRGRSGRIFGCSLANNQTTFLFKGKNSEDSAGTILLLLPKAHSSLTLSGVS